MNDVTALTFAILCALDFNKFIWFYFLLVWVLVVMKIRLKTIIIRTRIVPRFFPHQHREIGGKASMTCPLKFYICNCWIALEKTDICQPICHHSKTRFKTVIFLKTQKKQLLVICSQPKHKLKTDQEPMLLKLYYFLVLAKEKGIAFDQLYVFFYRYRISTITVHNSFQPFPSEACPCQRCINRVMTMLSITSVDCHRLISSPTSYRMLILKTLWMSPSETKTIPSSPTPAISTSFFRCFFLHLDIELMPEDLEISVKRYLFVGPGKKKKSLHHHLLWWFWDEASL